MRLIGGVTVLLMCVVCGCTIDGPNEVIVFFFFF